METLLMTYLFLWLPEIFFAATAILLIYTMITRDRGRAIPIDWPVVHMLPAVFLNFHRILEYGTDVLRESGCTFLLKGPWGGSMDILATADPANVHHIFNNNFANYHKGPKFYEIFDIFGRGIINTDGEEWKWKRNATHGLLADQKFRSFVVDTTFKKLEEGLIPVMDRAAELRTDVDMKDLLLRFTFDTTSILMMGVDPGCLSITLPSVPFTEAFGVVEEVIVLRHAFPVPLMRLLRRLDVMHERRLSRARIVVEDFFDTHIARRKNSLESHHRSSSGSPPPDILTSFLLSSDDRLKSDGLIRDSIVNLMVAGRDTIAASLSWFFYLVSTHPHVQERISDELRATERRPTGTEELRRMVYLHAALLETMRLYPPVPFEQKRALNDDALPSGHRVTPEMRVIVFMYAMGRMGGVWGEDCEEFRPERWIGEKGRLRHEPSYKYMVFNTGPRTCIGKDMALVQMKAVAAAVLGRYEVELVEGQAVEPAASIMLHMKNGLMMKVKRRSSAT